MTQNGGVQKGRQSLAFEVMAYASNPGVTYEVVADVEAP